MIADILHSRAWDALNSVVSERIEQLRSGLEGVQPEKLQGVQGRIKELRRLLDIIQSEDENHGND